MLAATAGKEEVAVMLAKRLPECIAWQNRAGLDAVRFRRLEIFFLEELLPF